MSIQNRPIPGITLIDSTIQEQTRQVILKREENMLETQHLNSVRVGSFSTLFNSVQANVSQPFTFGSPIFTPQTTPAYTFNKDLTTKPVPLSKPPEADIPSMKKPSVGYVCETVQSIVGKAIEASKIPTVSGNLILKIHKIFHFELTLSMKS